MNPLLWFGFQFSIMTLIAVGAWVSLKRYYGATFLTPKLRRILLAAILGGIAANLLTFVFHLATGGSAVGFKLFWVVKFGIYAWHFWLFFLWMTVMVMSVVRPLGSRALVTTHLGRRAFLKASSAMPIAVPLISIPAGAWGASRLKLRQVDLYYPKLPEALIGLTIGQLSDVHLGPFLGLDHLRVAVEAMRGLKPEIFTTTGDLADSWQMFEPAARILDSVESAHGRSYACIGNHEYYAGRWAFVKAFGYGVPDRERNRMRLLIDQQETIEVRGTKIRMIGVDFPIHARGKDEAPVKPGPFSGPREEFLICLAHHPKLFPQTADLGADLTLSGHIHAYQMRFAGISVGHVFSRYVDGVYRGATPEPSDRQLFVTAGTGHWLPLRFNCPPEIALITLSRGDPRESRWKLVDL